MILNFKDKSPKTGLNVFVAENAVLIGDVEIGNDSSVWFNSVIRGDVNFIKIGERTNIQDGSVLHVTHKKFPLTIGSDVTIGHNAIIHGCTIHKKVLIGMGAIVLDNSTVNSNSIVGAGSLVKENFIVPSEVLVAGVPARIIRDLRHDEIEMIKQSADNYVTYSKDYIKNIN